ncbi:GNAT family N-acetyltransferase [Natronospira bacteriovora]|uniref:GNAT family N-acetyltransferase n=1 Tax=Natronospira bacteriovora TaxID=3069753 RepID=A0ABU0W9Z9_9GAMM|nr:GNAT family N-acetyltransferase [Natronospira sp. AB-CW4]MDQ2070787.1 GNAT family N-acetyltransferase [Natronospira sp. AB-CW4]
MHDILAVNTPEQIADTARLARRIWREHYEPIIGQEQVAYMLERFQSEAAIAEQIAQGQEYYLAVSESGSSGYLAVIPEASERSLKISKIYVRRSERGSGVGRQLLALAEQRARELGLERLWLTVNVNNTGSIAWYEATGFVNTGPVVQDIGGGFIMDDYRFEKALA